MKWRLLRLSDGHQLTFNFMFGTVWFLLGQYNGVTPTLINVTDGAI